MENYPTNCLVIAITFLCTIISIPFLLFDSIEFINTLNSKQLNLFIAISILFINICICLGLMTYNIKIIKNIK